MNANHPAPTAQQLANRAAAVEARRIENLKNAVDVACRRYGRAIREMQALACSLGSIEDAIEYARLDGRDEREVKAFEDYVAWERYVAEENKKIRAENARVAADLAKIALYAFGE